MKNFLILIATLSFSATGVAQVVDNFEVGPYEVEYKEPGDYRYRLRKGVDLYDYYELKKDTTIVLQDVEGEPLDNALLVGLQYGLHGYGQFGATNKISVVGSYKQRIGSQLFFNAGVNLAIGLGDYGVACDNMSETMFEAGVPLSIELSDINRERASLYGTLGVVPTFFSSLSNSSDTGGDAYEGKKFSKSGFYVAPVIGIGAYVPVWGQLVRVGVFFQHNILFKDKESNVYSRRIGRSVFGAEVGIVF